MKLQIDYTNTLLQATLDSRKTKTDIAGVANNNSVGDFQDKAHQIINDDVQHRPT